MNKKVIAIIISVILVLLTVGLVIVISKDYNNDTQENINKEDDTNTVIQAPSKIDEDEKVVSENKAKEVFNFIPKVYTEEMTPFTSVFMLDAVMEKIIEENETQDFSVNNVDMYVKKIFGNSASINKDEVSIPDIARSLFYYSKEANSYAVIPVGYEGIYEYQILKNVTETDEAYYVYTYTLVGGYSYDEDSITQDEFGDLSYENAKIQVIVGDKDGNDLIHIFDGYTAIYDDKIWLEKYANIMPIFRYTLKKDGKNYYLTEVEQINY